MTFPRVTEILKAYSGVQYIPKDVLTNAAARGTEVHSLCAGIARGGWIPDEMVKENLLGYITSFRKWMAITVKDFYIVEKRYQHERLRFTGQIDFLVKKFDDTLLLVDIKTSAKPQKTYPLQIAGYRILLQEASHDVHNAAIVYLDKEGNMPLVHTINDFTESEHVFLSALDCWHYFNKGKKE